MVHSQGTWSKGGTALALAEWLICVVWPFLVWNTTMAFVTLQHHTHPDMRWFNSESEWSVFDGQVRETVEVFWPRWFQRLFLNIFSHTSHHVDKRIPLYHLPAAQSALVKSYPESVVRPKGSIGGLTAVLRKCRLYDYSAHRWMDWNGQYTT